MKKPKKPHRCKEPPVQALDEGTGPPPPPPPPPPQDEGPIGGGG